MNEYKYGTVRVPPSKFGNWEVIKFTITEEEAKFYNMRNIINRRSLLNVEQGEFVRLVKGGSEVVMSNTLMELETNQVAYENATGNVLIAGLGMGMILDAILSKPDVTKVRIIELDQDIIDNIGVLYKDHPKVEIVQGSIFDYTLQKDEYYNYIWFDIWTYITNDNIEEILELHSKFCRHCKWMSFWSIEFYDEEHFEDIGGILI